MWRLRRFLSRLLHVLRPHQGDDDLAREISSHLALLEEAQRRRDLTPEAAGREARRLLGGVEQVKERHRDERSLRWLDDSRRDVQDGARTLWRTPGFTAIAILTLALGIGANTAIFSVVHALLLKPLPYKDADRLVHLVATVPAAQSPTGQPIRAVGTISIAERFALEPRTSTLSHVGFAIPALMTLSGQDEMARVQGALVEPAILQMLGVRPLLGRVFGAGEESAHPADVVILSAATWHRYFHGAPNIVGRRLRIEGKDREVVGILPDTFAFPDRQTEFWIPLELRPVAGPSGHGRAPMLARLADGATLQRASSEVDAILGPIGGDGWRYELVRAQDTLVGPVRSALLLLMGTVGAVLCIACGNVASLSLTRISARQHEIATRVALGASAARVVRQLLAESVLVGVAGGAAGIALAFGALRLLRPLATTLTRWDLGLQAAFPRLDEIGIDLTVLGFTIAASIATGVVCGLAPALRAARRDAIAGLKSGGPSAAIRGQPRAAVLRGALVVGEVAMATVLLVAGALLTRSFINLSAVDPGYVASNVLTFQAALPEDYSGPRITAFAESVVARLEATPGVQAAAYAFQLPTVDDSQTLRFRRTPDYPEQTTALPLPGEDARLVSSRYLEVLGIRVIAGRTFAVTDRADQPRVLIINEALARRDFNGEDPIGKTAYVGRSRDPWQIVGVVKDVRQFGLAQPPQPQVFVDFRQWSGTGHSDEPRYFAVRMHGDPLSLTAGLRTIVRAVDGRAGVFNVATLEHLVSNALSRPRLYAVLFGLFAAVAVVLAAIGVYGVLTYSVAQRRREIGIRMALGARPAAVVSLVAGQTAVLTIAGIVIGLALAAMLTRYIEWMLFDLAPHDAATFLIAAALFATVAAVATLVPARRATRIDPVLALRVE